MCECANPEKTINCGRFTETTAITLVKTMFYSTYYKTHSFVGFRFGLYNTALLVYRTISNSTCSCLRFINNLHDEAFSGTRVKGHLLKQILILEQMHQMNFVIIDAIFKW